MSKHTIQQFATLNKDNLRFFNMYGPTEISLVATSMELLYRDENIISAGAGYTLPNYTVYIVDEQMRLVPPGVLGEIYVGGAGVAIGYLNNATFNSGTIRT